MGDRLLKKLNYIVGLLPVGALFGLAAFVAKIEIKDLDLWLHIGVGKYIWTNGIVPATDFLSCSIQGNPWINHEWLFQIIVYNIFERFGAHGLHTMQIGIVLLTMLLLLFLGYSKEKQITTAFSLMLVYLVFSQRFTIRPDLFSLLFFTVFILTLALHIDKKWSVPVLFVVQVLWSNMHGFFFFGPLFVLIGLVSEWIRRHIKLPFEWNDSGNLTDDEYSRLKRIFLVVIAACLINPQTFKGAFYPIGVFFSISGEGSVFFTYIQELQKPLEGWGDLFTAGPFVHYKLLVFLSAVSFVYNRRRIDISALFFWGVFLVFSLKAIRNLPFFAFAAYLVIITNMLNISYKDIIPFRFNQKKFEYLTLIFLKMLLLAWIFNYMNAVSSKGYYDFDKYDMKSEFGDVSLRSFPNKAVDFLIENKVSGNFFNDFNSGAYLIGRTFPDIKVFIDGRTEVYGAEFFKTYQKIWDEGDQETFEEVVKKYNITGAFLNTSRQHVKKKLVEYLFKSEEWEVVYFNYDAVIFLKNVEKNKEIIGQHRIDLTQWEVKETDLKRLGPVNVLPYQPYFRAYTLESIDLDEIALKEAQESLKMMPNYSPAYQLIGKIYGKRNDNEKAFEYFRLAAMFTPNDIKNRTNLALAYLKLEDYDQAIKQYEKIIQYWPQDPKGYFLITKAYATKKDYELTLKAIQKAHQMDSKNYDDIITIGDIVFNDGEYLVAQKIYEIAYKANSGVKKVYEKLGEVHEVQQNFKEAVNYLQKALELDPENEDLENKIESLKNQISTVSAK